MLTVPVKISQIDQTHITIATTERSDAFDIATEIVGKVAEWPKAEQQVLDTKGPTTIRIEVDLSDQGIEPKLILGVSVAEDEPIVTLAFNDAKHCVAFGELILSHFCEPDKDKGAAPKDLVKTTMIRHADVRLELRTETHDDAKLLGSKIVDDLEKWDGAVSETISREDGEFIYYAYQITVPFDDETPLKVSIHVPRESNSVLMLFNDADHCETFQATLHLMFSEMEGAE